MEPGGSIQQKVSKTTMTALGNSAESQDVETPQQDPESSALVENYKHAVNFSL